MSVTDLDLRRALKVLCSEYKMPADLDDKLFIWRETIGKKSPTSAELMLAVYRVCETRDRNSGFPTPFVVLDALQQIRREEATQRQRSTRWSGDGPCPVCGAPLRELTAEEQATNGGEPSTSGRPRWGWFHDLDEHDRQGEPAIGGCGFRRSQNLLPARAG